MPCILTHAERHERGKCDHPDHFEQQSLEYTLTPRTNFHFVTSSQESLVEMLCIATGYRKPCTMLG